MLSGTSVPRQPANNGSKAVFDFDLKQNGRGSWVVTGADDHGGETFLTRDAALKFACAERDETIRGSGSRIADQAA